MLPSRLGLRLGRWLVVTAVIAAAMIAVAGRLDLVTLNAYLVMCSGVALAATLMVDPELVKERLRHGQKGEDAARLLVIRILVLAAFVAALLDIGRLHASDSVPRALQVAALGLAGAAFLWVVWALSVNRFFVPVIRIQTERGHRVVDHGPYRRMRHPGYAGMALAMPASALALGSWWALLPALGAALLFVRRAAHEDRFLRQKLEGYEPYAARVRYRLLPGVW
jgi:protein-S-isoprenylcysteine O-methyltransferase Ste14